ncbi:MAG: arsenate reductase (glutaredoxin) [Fimbriimonadaceae bacterium]|nr:arsenate reductase (glutaredoxin) [Fimbriimonadaceae bacterium]
MELWHNPRCSKSRQALALLQEAGREVTVRLYLEQPPTAVELRAVLAKLGRGPRDLLRRGEALYRELGLADADRSDDELIAAMVAHPILIERPLAVGASSAAMGRPPEQVLAVE